MAAPEDDTLPWERFFYREGVLTDADMQHTFDIPLPIGRTAGQDRIPTRRLLVTDNGLYDVGYFILNSTVARITRFFRRLKGNLLYSRAAFLIYGYSETPDWVPTRDSFHWTWHTTILSFVGNMFDKEMQRQRLITLLRSLAMDTVRFAQRSFFYHPLIYSYR